MPKAINVDLDAPIVTSTPSATQTEPKPQTVKPSEVLRTSRIIDLAFESGRRNE